MDFDLDIDDVSWLARVEEEIKSGRFAEEFRLSLPERKGRMLELLERLMDVAELADETATQLIFENSQLGAFFGKKTEMDLDEPITE